MNVETQHVSRERRASRNREQSVQRVPRRVSHQYVRVHGDPSFMLRVGVGARGRRYRYTYGTSRIRPTVAKVTKVESRGFRRIHRTAWRASTWPTSARAIKDGTSARSSSSTGRLTVTRTVHGSTWTFTVSNFHLRIMFELPFLSLNKNHTTAFCTFSPVCDKALSTKPTLNVVSRYQRTTRDWRCIRVVSYIETKHKVSTSPERMRHV